MESKWTDISKYNVTTSGLYSVRITGGNGCPAYSIPVQVTVNQILRHLLHIVTHQFL